MPEIVLPAHGWRPRPHQMRLWSYLQKGGTRAMAIWHRRAGKDEVLLNHTAVSAFQRPGNYWHCLPIYKQARKAIWTAVDAHTGVRRIDRAFPRETRDVTNESEMFIRFKNGSTWHVQMPPSTPHAAMRCRKGPSSQNFLTSRTSSLTKMPVRQKTVE